MALVEARTGFDHYGSRKRGERFSVSDQVARKLRDGGLVDIVEVDGPRPEKAAGSPSSALPAARRSARKTAIESDAGEKPRRKRKSAEQS